LLLPSRAKLFSVIFGK
jgi:hypothetical protein